MWKKEIGGKKKGARKEKYFKKDGKGKIIELKEGGAEEGSTGER